MDNLFEILIYVVIIISFLSSIFRRKAKPKQPPERTTHQEEYPTYEVSIPQSQQKSEYDILKEIEGFFSEGEKVSHPESEQTSLDTSTSFDEGKPKRMAEVEEHSRTESWHTTTASEHVADVWEKKKEDVRKRIARVDKSVEERATVFQESLVKTRHKQSEITAQVKSRFKNPSTLKEYIIISEIIGKPKSLHR